MKPHRIQLRRSKGWRLPPNTIKVDRATPWGNPFIVGKSGDAAYCVQLYRCLLGGYLNISNGEACCQRQDKAIVALKKEKAAGWPTLRGKNLACWCPLPKVDEPDICHAAVLLELANRDDR